LSDGRVAKKYAKQKQAIAHNGQRLSQKILWMIIPYMNMLAKSKIFVNFTDIYVVNFVIK
jgi:hypothetical protein